MRRSQDLRLDDLDLDHCILKEMYTFDTDLDKHNNALESCKITVWKQTNATVYVTNGI